MRENYDIKIVMILLAMLAKNMIYAWMGMFVNWPKCLLFGNF